MVSASLPLFPSLDAEPIPPAGDAADTRPWLVGESNPYQGPDDDPEHTYDLYPAPDGSSGQRLCQVILGLSRRDYLRLFQRRDLLAERWSVPAARASARDLLARSGRSTLVLLGGKVCAAFGVPFHPFTYGAASDGRAVAILPHPSGLSRAWNGPGAYGRARRLVLPLVGRAP